MRNLSDKSSSPPPPPPPSTYPATATTVTFQQETPRTLCASPDQFSPEWLSCAAGDTRTTVVTFGGGRETTIGKSDLQIYRDQLELESFS